MGADCQRDLAARRDVGRDSQHLALFSIKAIAEDANSKPEAQCYLDDPVSRGLVDIAKNGTVVVALDLHSPTYVSYLSVLLPSQHIFRPGIDVISLQRHADDIAFIRLARHRGLSHIRVFQGSLIGFALDNDLSVPSVLNWKTGQILHLQEAPDTDVSSRDH